MATVNKIDTTFTGKDIHTAASVYEYTANGTYKVRFQIQLTSLAGGGDYSVWATLNDGDAVGDYVIHPKTTITLAAGAQSIWIVSGEIDVMSGDVVNIYALGLAGDTAVAGIVRVFSDDASATIDPTGLATSTALAVVDANVDAIKAKMDALDVSSVTVVTAVVGTTITVLRGDTLRAPLLKLGDLTQYVSLDFTVKSNVSNSDENAVIRVRKNSSGTDDGLLRLNKAPHATGTDGSITITDPAVGDITIMLKASVTLDLVPGAYVYDIQRIEADGVKTLTSGNLIVAADVTRAVA